LPGSGEWFGDRLLAQVRAERGGASGTLLSQARRSAGEAVRLVQQALLFWGYELPRLDVLPRFGADGDFGTETSRAVELFQTRSGVAVDGIVGPLTFAKDQRNITFGNATFNETLSAPVFPPLVLSPPRAGTQSQNAFKAEKQAMAGRCGSV